jgi:glycosyltransferase involved in cell wall biosynthesis
MKRIAQVITRMVSGGASGNVRALIAGGGRRHDFTLFTGPEDVTEQDLANLRERCPVVVIPSMARAIRPFADWRAYRELLCEFRKERFDVVHCHTSKAGFLGRMAAAKAGVPVIVHSPEGTIYAADSRIPGVPAGGIGLRLLRMAEQVAGRHTTWLTALSQDERDICIRLGLSREDNTIAIPNGIDLAAFQPRAGDRAGARREFGVEDDELLLLSVGRLSKEKGHDVLIEAFANLADRLPKARLMLVGDGPERAALGGKSEIRNPKSETGEFRQDGQDKQDKSEIQNPKSETREFRQDGQEGQKLKSSMSAGAARSPSFASRIIFAGHREDVQRLLAAADIFVLPSRYEGFGLAVVEAMAAGVPVVASRVGGVPEIIRDGIDGILVPGGDAEALAGAIATLAADASVRQRLGRAGHARSQDFSREKMLAAYYRLYG